MSSEFESPLFIYIFDAFFLQVLSVVYASLGALIFAVVSGVSPETFNSSQVRFLVAVRYVS